MNALNNYQLTNCLYQGYRTEVYRALCTTNQLPVVIKFLRSEYPTFSELVEFRNQYTISKNLEIPGIVKPLTLETYRNSYALVMEDWGGISLNNYIKNHSLSLTQLLAIAIQIADILHDLYQHRVIHKDVKPANILIHPESKQIKLIDFSIASLLPKETAEVKHPNVLQGTLAYLAPEQTGRMNRGVDYRTDFYGLGVTLFELLAGVLPFQSADPLELVHCHIAKPAPNLCEIKPEIPSSIGQIVAKLMAKNAEERYQSALGVKYDLENCLHQLQETGKIELFNIGQKDVSDRFIIPEKLYGRESEVKTLLEAFFRVASLDRENRAANGSTEMMLVTGFSGIGKTAVINEIHKPIVRQRGYFIKGKFDQFNRNIPLSAFVQAFRDLMKQLLSESDTQLQVWKSEILEILGEHGQVIIEVIPELERIIGAQPPVPELSGTAAHNRFNLLFQKFLKLFAKPEHPLAIFLDDLQWADAASLNLMQLLMASETGYLLLLGAYRDNEVFAAHPLMLTLDAVRKAGAIVNEITLQPLSQFSLNQLVADTLNCDEKLANPLTELIAQKTQGNPFFATQFLKALHQDRLIAFDSKAGYWQCDIVRVREAALTDDVVEFMALQLQKLPPATQEILKLAACIGNQFDLQTLAIVSEKSSVEAAADLWKALQEGLILPITETYKFFQSTEAEIAADRISVPYKFLHDRVQQAAYSLIPEHRKQSTHLQIGKLILNHHNFLENTDSVFDTVNQFNYAIELIIAEDEREQLAKLNLTAGMRARAATAYIAAANYFQVGRNLLANDSWQTRYDFTLELYVKGAEVAYLCADFDEMERLVFVVLSNARTLLDKVKVYDIKLSALTAQTQPRQAVDLGINVLKLLGIYFPDNPNAEDIQQRLAATALLFADKNILQTIELPEMVDLEKKAALQILSGLVSPAYITAPTLLPLIILEMVHLSVAYGNAPLSAFAYGLYGLILTGIIQDISTGYEFGKLALSIVDLFQETYLKTKINYTVGAHIFYSKNHLGETIKLLKEGYVIGLETGDLEMGYSAKEISQISYLSGQELTSLEPEINAYSKAVARFGQAAALRYNQIIHQAVLNLLGDAENPCILQGKIYNEELMLPLHIQAGDRNGLHYFYFHQMILCYLFEDRSQALKSSLKAEEYLDAVTGMINVPLFFFYDSLVRLAIHSDACISDRETNLIKVQGNQEKLRKWAQNAPMNFLHKFDLVKAEKCRVVGEGLTAIDLYDRAIAGAKANEYIQEEALGNELAAKFYLDWGKEKVAAGYMQEAYYCYAKWGSKAKTDDLEQRYPNLLRPILQQVALTLSPLETLATLATGNISIRSTTTTKGRSSSSSSINTVFDFAAILKASQALSSTIQLDELLHQLTQIILQNSGGDSCALILPHGDLTWQVRAIATSETTELCSTPLEGNPNLPLKLIQYVKNTQQVVVIDDCQTDLPVIGEYLERERPKSILCLPLLDRGHLIGILYLKNRSTSGVFTRDRLLILNFLCSQAAISLENARLYHQVQQTLQELQQAQLQLVQSEKMSALGNLVAGVAHEINNPVGCIVGNVNAVEDCINDLLGLIDLYGEKFPQPGTEIEDELEDIDLDYVREDLPKLIKAMKDGGERIKSISQSLRTFSRADSDAKQTFNIHDGINSTLLILRHRLKANDQRPEIQVVTDYGNLPAIQCFPGQLNQVFMNVLANALDALDESNWGRSFAEIKLNPNRITLRTYVEGERVKINIADNGKGMSAEVKCRIFDHLFTTKAVGKGTGLGLAIARQIIVEKHGGAIEVNSVLGKGTDFKISLPMQ